MDNLSKRILEWMRKRPIATIDVPDELGTRGQVIIRLVKMHEAGLVQYKKIKCGDWFGKQYSITSKGRGMI